MRALKSQKKQVPPPQAAQEHAQRVGMTHFANAEIQVKAARKLPVEGKLPLAMERN